MNTLIARLLYVAAACIARIPWRLQHAFAMVLGRQLYARNSRMARATVRNLELIGAAGDATGKRRDAIAILQTTVMQALETLRIWTRPAAQNLKAIRQVHGAELFQQAIADGRGVIVAAPHYGNWELLNQWLAETTPLAILYAPPSHPAVDAFLNRVRADQVDRVTQVPADGPTGVRTLLKWLKNGSVVGILPDQQPKLGEGEFAPFFGYPALTMSLLSRLAAKTGVPVLMAYCERVDEHNPTFEIHVEPAADGIHSNELDVSVAALNASVERIARRDFRQYQWTYKRFTKQIDDQNPYWPDCY